MSSVVAISGCLSELGDAETGDGLTDRRVKRAMLEYQHRAQRVQWYATVQVDANGVVERRFPSGKQETLQLDRDELRELQREIAEADLPTLEPRYGCGGCADGLIQTVTLRVGGATYETGTDQRSLLPANAVPLFDRLQAFVSDPDEQQLPE